MTDTGKQILEFSTATRRIGATVLMLALAISACFSAGSPVLPSAAASPSGFCTEVGGHWDGGSATCETTVTNAKHVSVAVTAKYPNDLIDDPTAGPVLQKFLRTFFQHFGRADDTLSHDGSVKLDYQVLGREPATKSVVFTNNWFLGGAHPNDEISTFTFDLVKQKQLALADLFCPGTDPLQSLYPYVAQYVQPPVDSGSVQPGGQGINYSSDYTAWAIDGDDLVIYMPAGRSGPANAGSFKARIPRSAMKSILRDGSCST